MAKAHITRLGESQWFVGWGYGSCFGRAADTFRQACDIASLITLKMRRGF